MIEVLSSIIKQVNRINRKPLNILTFSTHESWQSFLAMTGHNFYHLPSPERKNWMVDYRPIPPNVKFIHNNPGDIVFDVILSQTAFGQFQNAENMARIYSVPHVNVEHTLPMKEWDKKQLDEYREMKLSSDCRKFIFITEFNMKKWGFTNQNSDIIYHGIDTDLFCGAEYRDNKAICVANMYKERGNLLGWDIFEKTIIANNIQCEIVGDNGKLSKRANGISDLIKKLRSATVFFNTSLWSPIPISVLEAMAVGLPVITTDTCDLPRVIQNGYNGFIGNDIQFLTDKLKWCLDPNNKEHVVEMGRNARNTIIDKFNITRFINKWNTVFNEATGIIDRK